MSGAGLLSRLLSRRFHFRSHPLVSLLGLALASASLAVLPGSTGRTLAPDPVVLWGPRFLASGTGTARTYVEDFAVSPAPDAHYVLVVERSAARVRSIQISLNGRSLVGAASLSATRTEIPVTPLASNRLQVTLEGDAGSGLTLSLVALSEAAYAVFGPHEVVHAGGTATRFLQDFTLPAGASGPFTLEIVNGSPGGTQRVELATLRLNGQSLLVPGELSTSVAGVRKTVALKAQNTVDFSIGRTAGVRATLRITATDAAPPVLEVASPAEGARTRASEVEVSGTVEDQTAVEVKVNGVPAARSGNAFTATVALASEGENALVVEATDRAGLTASLTRRVVRDTQAPVIALSSPADGVVTRLPSVTVAGTISESGPVQANVNGVPVTPDGTGAFSVEVALNEGTNFVTLSATDAAGNGASAARQVVLDTQAPLLEIASPAEGASTEAEEVEVKGTVTDATAVTLTVGGSPAAVGAGGAFTTAVPLNEGANAIQVVATDAAGNSVAQTRNVTRAADSPLGPDRAEGPIPQDPQEVAPLLDPTIVTPLVSATSFLYEGENPIQTGVAPGTIAPERVAVVRGRVLKRDGTPLEGVRVSVHDHPELGQTISREDGAFDLAVNGGNVLTIDYERSGYFRAQRQVEVPWQDYVNAPEVALVKIDPVVTEVALDPSVTEIQVARGSVQQDADGSRQATLFFEPGTKAEMVMPDGTSLPLTSLSVRATEYTVGENGPLTMPASLPPTSAYTYAVELSVDQAIEAGADHVVFSKPVPFYVENFLEFPVGLAVPVGAYDARTASWLPELDGRVIGIVGVASGLAEIDANGDMLPDGEAQLAALGIDPAERARLARTYTEGTTLWRAQVTHFSWIDLNYPRGSPDAENPNPDDPEGDDPEDDPCNSGGSVIECENQTLGERIGVTGTGFALNYRSDRVPGRTSASSLRIPLIGARVPTSLRTIHLEIEVAGRTFKKSFPATPEQSYQFVWDGKDAFGRQLRGKHPVRVRIGYAYPQFYLVPASSARSFGLTCSGPSDWGSYWQQCIIPTTVNTWARQEDVRWKYSQAEISASGNFDARQQALAGWTLDVHHAYDTQGRTLYTGDGGRRGASNLGNVITTVAGTGLWYGDGSSGVGITTPMQPSGVAVAPDGSVYISSYATDQVFRLFPDGTVQTIAGNGSYGCFGDGGPATEAELAGPDGVWVGHDGSVYIDDAGNDAIRKVDRNGIITTVAGTHSCSGSSGGDMPQMMMMMSAPAISTMDAAETSPEPTREPGYRKPTPRESAPARGGLDLMMGAALSAEDPAIGDGGPATEATLSSPYGVVTAPDGSIYIADYGHNRIRKVSPNGIITTVAGTGEWGFSGDGGAATAATLFGPWGVALGPDGSLYISDTGNDRIRRVTPDGIITTVAGSGQWCFPSTDACGDGGPATQARLDTPDQVVVGPDGSIYIPDTGTSRIRRVSPEGIISTVAGNGNDCWPANGPCGDNGPATAAPLAYMYGVALGHSRDLYIAVTGSYKVRRTRTPVPGYTGAEIMIASENGSELYEFDPNGRHLRTRHTHTGGVMFEFEYDSAGRLAAVRDGDGLRTLIERAVDGSPTAITSAYGTRTALAVDANGYLAGITDPTGAEIGLTHGEGGLLTGLTDPRGGEYVFAYDAVGRLLRDTDPAGGYQALARTSRADGYTATRTTAGGRTTTYRVDQLPTGDLRRTITQPNGLSTTVLMETEGRVTTTAPDGTRSLLSLTPDPRFGMQLPITQLTVTTPSGLTQTMLSQRETVLSDAGDPLSLAEQVDRVSINGRTFLSHFDAAQRLYTTTTPEGRESELQVDALGRVLRSEVPGITPLTYGYTANGRLAGSVQGTRTWSYEYDAAGMLSMQRDPSGREVRFAYDAAGRMLGQKLPDGREILYAYDASGNLTSITPAGRPAHTFTFSAIDRAASYTPPSLGGGDWSTRYTYNLDRQLVRALRPDGDSIGYRYDAAGRLAAVAFPGGSITHTYSGTTGLLSGQSRSDGATLAFSYDGSLLTGTTWSGPVAGSVGVTYDADFRPATQAVNGSQSVSYRYDGDGLLTGVGALNLTRNVQNGQVTAVTLGGLSESYTYDSFGVVATAGVRFGATQLYAAEFGRDALGRITRRTETIAAVKRVQEFRYDAAGRLVEVRLDGAVTEAYQYDSNGNRTFTVYPGGTLAASYDDQDRLLAYGDAAFTYTVVGDLRTRTDAGGTTEYQYDALGNLRSVRLRDGGLIEYVVDPQNRRIGKKVNGTLMQGFLYQDALAPVAELNGSGALVSRFVYGSRANVPDYMIKAGVTYRIVADHLGSVRLVVNTSTGAVAQRLEYDAFGRVTLDSSPGFQPFGYAGGLYDRQTGLVRFGARDYDPVTGRWTAKDPVGFQGGDPNLYGYVLQDPVNLIDPSGNLFWDLVDAGFFLNDLVRYIRCRDNGTDLLLSAAGVLPVIPSPRYLKAADDIVDAARRPSKFRKQTVQDAWDNAADGPNGGKLCPTCSTEVNVKPGDGPRDWDIDHQPPWSTRDQSGRTRQEVLDDYNTGTRLECPSCNRGRGARPAGGGG